MNPGEPPWTDFGPDVEPRAPRRQVDALIEPEPIPQRNPLAVTFDLVLIFLVVLVVTLGFLGKLDWLLDLADALRR